MGQYDNITNLGISFGDGNENVAGIAEEAYLVPLSWLKTEVFPDPAGTTAESLVTITGNHLMKTGKAPIHAIPLFEKSGLAWELAGELLSKIFNQGVELFIPDNGAVSLGTLRAIKNYRFILLIRKIDGSGDCWQVGSSYISAKVENAAGGTGQGPTGEPGTRITLRSYGLAPAFIYKGAIPPTGT